MPGDEITVTSTTDGPEEVASALAEGTEPESGETKTLEEPEHGGGGEDDGEGREAEDEGGASDTDEDTADAPPKSRRRRGGQRTMQQRIDTLTWQVNRERAEREELARQLEQAKNPQSQQPPQEPVFNEPEPDINNYETLEDWQRDVSAWNRRFAKWEMQRELDARLQNVITPEKVRANQIQQSFQEALDSYRTEVPEFKDLAQQMIEDQVPTTPLMNEHFLHSGPMGPKLMHWLALNPDECRRIAALPSGPQLVALGKIESKIEAGALSGRNGAGSRESTAPAAQVPVSRQSNRNQPPPEPPNPVGARGGTGPKNPDNMSYDEYKRWRRQQGAR